MDSRPTVLDICAGAGGSALGMEAAGYEHAALIEIDSKACDTLRCNRPFWNVIQQDLRDILGREFSGVDVVVGGLPSPPFSIAGQQLGIDDSRDLFPAALRIIEAARPRVVVLDNVKGFLSQRFDAYRSQVLSALNRLGYESELKLINAADYGVPQSRPVVLLVSARKADLARFHFPEPCGRLAVPVGHALYPFMASRGWRGAERWRSQAAGIAPAIVGGSRKHGGPDLGPTRTKRSWEQLGVNGLSLADDPPDRGFTGLPRLTLPMVAALQGFPSDWRFIGGKTDVYRQIAQALPPPVANMLGIAIRSILVAL